MEKKLFTKNFIIGLIITFAISLVVALIIFLIGVLTRQGSGHEWNYEIYENVIDSLTLSGGLGVLIYLLSVLSSKGAFDMIAYSVKVVWVNTFHKNVKDTALPRTYAEYKELKHGKEQDSTLFLLLGSLPTLIAGLIVMIPYYVNIR